MPTDYDVLIIGAGHNGLTAAAYLAKAGLSVLVLERRPVIGGATLSDEIFPGYTFPRYAYALLLFEGKIAEDLELEKHGLQVLQVEPERIHPFPDGNAIRVWNEDIRVAEEVSKIFKPDGEAYVKWASFWERAASILQPYMMSSPPTLGELVKGIRSPKDEDVLEQILFGNAYDMLDQYFESDQVKAAFGWSFNDSPIFYARLETARFGNPRFQGIVKGGMGSLPLAIEMSARAEGVKFVTDAEVKHVLVEKGVAIGVVLADGMEIKADVVLSNADPKRTFTQLIEEQHLGSDFLIQVRNLKNMRSSLKLHATLSDLPDLSHYFGKEWDPKYLGRVRMCPSLGYALAGRADADAGRRPSHPSMIMQVPSIYDPTMAPQGKHCMSVWVETAAFNLKDESWDDVKEELSEFVVDALSVYAPNIKDAIIDKQMVTPLDLEREIGITNGDILHLDMVPRQFFASRPMPGWSSYRTPIDNLYLCGAGTHPGGYVSGAPGHNAAQTIIGDLEVGS